MTSTRRAAMVLVVTPALALAACAGGVGAGAGPADTAAIAEWSEPAGIAPELVYVTDVDGFELATQSVGVFGDDGMSSVYMRVDDGATLMLTTARTPEAGTTPCAELGDPTEAILRCGVDRDDVHVALAGDGVEAATLLSAAEAVRAPGAGELSHLFADVQVAEVPVERGDLPPEGDGAPVDPPAEGA